MSDNDYSSGPKAVISKYSRSKLVEIDGQACIRCGLCLESCPTKAIEFINGQVVAGSGCCGCLSCFENCPSNAVILLNTRPGLAGRLFEFNVMKEPCMDIKKVVLVTGGARGIGRATALKLAGPETAVIITHVNPNSPGATETLAALKEKSAAAEAQCWAAEDSESAKKHIEEIAARYGRLDVLVNNAGCTRDNLSVRLSDDDWREVLDANLFGVFACSRVAAKIMMKQRSGRIVNLSSVVAFSGNIGQANYCASKAGVIALTKTMALELASRGITVNAVAPGFIDTDMTSGLSGKIKEALLSRVPQNRLGTVDEVASAVAFLASEEASYVTGHTLHVNGGLYM